MIRAGFFGKLPSRGDFVRVGLSRSFTQAWDGWLDQVLPAARSALGEEWDRVWRTAPAWRFRRPAAPSTRAVSGVWLPSADRVGRAFPLVLAAEEASSLVLDALEAAGRRAIAEAHTPAMLASRLAEIGPGEATLGPSGACWWREAGGTMRRVEGAAPDLAVFLGMIAA